MAGTFPVLRGGKNTNSGTSVASLAMGFPAGAQSGDLAITWAVCPNAFTFTAPDASWSTVTGITGTNFGAQLFWKFGITAADIATPPSFSPVGGSARFVLATVVFSGASAFDITPATSGQRNASSATITAPTITTIQPATIVWFGAGELPSGTTSDVITAPASYLSTLMDAQSTTNGTTVANITVLAATLNQATPGAQSSTGSLAVAQINGAVRVAVYYAPNDVTAARPGPAWMARFQPSNPRRQHVFVSLPTGTSASVPVSDSDVSAAGADGGEKLSLSDSDTGHGTDGGESLAVTLSDSDTGHGADAQTLAAALSDSDAAAGAAADAQALAVTLPGSDTGSGSDSGAVTGLTQPELLRARPGPAWLWYFKPGLTRKPVIPLWGNPVAVSFDTGSGLDAGEKLALSDSDTGSGADAQSVAAALSGADTGSGADAGEKLSPSSADTGIAADAGEKLSPSSADTGSGADAGEKLSPSDADTGHGVDAGSVAAALAGTDTGSGADAGEKVNPVAADTGSGAETPVLAVSDADTGHGADAGTVLAAVPGADTGTGADAGEKLALSAAETGAGADTGVLTGVWGQEPVRAQPGPAWLARFRPWSPRRVIALPAPPPPFGTPVSDSDVFAGADAQALAVALPGSDTGSAAETQSLALADSDTGTAADGGEQARQPGADTVSAADGGEILALASADTASAADTAQTLALDSADTGSAADDGQVRAALADDDTGSSIEAGTAGTGGHPVADGDTGTGYDAGSPLFATFLIVTTEIGGLDVVIAVGGPEFGITILDPHGNAVS